MMEAQGEFPLESCGQTSSYHLFHDEAGFAAKQRYGVHGILAVPDHLLVPLWTALRRERAENRYWSEIHFTDLGGSGVKRSASWQTAHAWLRLFFEYALNGVRFKAFAVDMQHSEFDRKRYPNETAAYRRFAITVAKALIAWSLRGDRFLLLTAFTDHGNPSAQRLRRDGRLFDKFHVYVERECRREKIRNGKRFYPEVRFRQPLRAVRSSPSQLTQEDAELLGCTLDELRMYSDYVQLVDLLAGCVNAALSLKVQSEGKVRLAEAFASHLARNYELPWHRSLDRRRSMSVSMFPGPGRTPYAISLAGVKKAGLLAIQSDPTLKALFSERYGFRPDAVLRGQIALPGWSAA